METYWPYYKFPPVVIGQKSHELIFFEVQWKIEKYFVSILKDSTVYELKQSLLRILSNDYPTILFKVEMMELFQPFYTYDKLFKLNDTTVLSSIGFLPDKATPVKPAILVLTYENQQPQKAVFKERFDWKKQNFRSQKNISNEKSMTEIKQ